MRYLPRIRRKADSLGFQYLVEAGYNPGGAAASMSVLLDKYGDKPRTGLKGVIAPADHPSTKERVEKNGKRLYEYSGNHVKAKDNWILINGEKNISASRNKTVYADGTGVSDGRQAGGCIS